MPYRPTEIEPRWQDLWDAQETFKVTEDRSKAKYYVLGMFPYPSGKGLHVGHPAGYTAGDVVSRMRRAQGYNVLQPIGYDAFGLPAEQRAIQEGIAPQTSTREAIENFRGQLKRLGLSYDWSRELSTADPEYYKWTQWIFTKLYEKALAYPGEMLVNWCPALGTVLANDEVIEGRSERGGFPVERKKMRQWMLRITDYAQRLLDGLDTLDWPEATKAMQREWIGRSEGAYVHFALQGFSELLTVFTTRPDTLFGATYMVLAPDHALVEKITTEAQREAVRSYQRQSAGKSEIDRKAAKTKTGVDTGARAKNPANGELIPVWIADYVLSGYGTGAIMAVPAHDLRDWDFARAMGLPMREVISGGEVSKGAYTGEGSMLNSGVFDGTPTRDREAVRRVSAWLESEALGQGAVTYKLRDWVFSRQRYWGEPIPVLKQGEEVVRVLDLDELPLELPEVIDYKPSASGDSALSRAKTWCEVIDPESAKTLTRETHTMPGSAGSSWYFLRYCDPHNTAEFCARDKSDYWMPVDLYVGGDEHAVGHLLYARMWHKVLFDLGLVRDEEPFKKLRHQGMVLGEAFYDLSRAYEPDKGLVSAEDTELRGEKYYRAGTETELQRRVEKMAKSKGNVVNPDEVIATFGADALRVYLCFLGPLEEDKPWQPLGLEGQFSFMKRIWRLYFEGDEDRPRVSPAAATEQELRVLHKAIKKVTRDIESLDLNTAISALHVATRELNTLGTRSREVLESLAKLYAPFAPHIAEELWFRGLGHPVSEGGISYAPWPTYDDRYAVDNTVTLGAQVNGKTYATLELAPDAEEATAVAAAREIPAVARQLEGKALVKVIYKAGRILNLVVK